MQMLAGWDPNCCLLLLELNALSLMPLHACTVIALSAANCQPDLILVRVVVVLLVVVLLVVVVLVVGDTLFDLHIPHLKPFSVHFIQTTTTRRGRRLPII